MRRNIDCRNILLASKGREKGSGIQRIENVERKQRVRERVYTDARVCVFASRYPVNALVREASKQADLSHRLHSFPATLTIIWQRGIFLFKFNETSFTSRAPPPPAH